MTVRAILDTKGHHVESVQPGAKLSTAVKLLGEKKIGAVLVLNMADRIDGILSERDVVRSLAAHATAALDQSVTDLMTRQVTTCAPKDTIEQLMWLMTDKRIRHLPVVGEDGGLAGIVSIGDVVKHRLGQLESENQALYEYITQGR